MTDTKLTQVPERTTLPMWRGLLFFVFVGIVIAGCSPEPDSRNTERQRDPLVELESAQPSTLKPSGELAEIFAIGSDYTQLQREIKLKEIQKKIIEWRLPVYEVSRSGDGYRIQTYSGLTGEKLVHTFVFITPRKEEDRRLIETIKTGDWVAVKGVIADVTMRSLEIKPAILATNNPVSTQAKMVANEVAAAENQAKEESDFVAARRADTEEGYAAYLRDHPAGKWAAFALERQERVKAEADAARQPLPDEATRRKWQTSANTATAAMLPGTTFKDCPDCPAMVIIPAGEFQMGEKDLIGFYGSQGSGQEAEGRSQIRSEPVHNVVMASTFAIGQTEITNRQWRSLMGSVPDNDNGKEVCGDDCPVRGPTWDEVQKYILRLNAKTGRSYRLPSESEWEYACRAGQRKRYCGSSNLDSVAWHARNSITKGHPVARKRANAFGLYDMSGNVKEWVQDCTNDSYIGAPMDGSAWLAGDCYDRIARGGAWNGSGHDFYATIRDAVGRSGSPIVGFRLARELK